MKALRRPGLDLQSVTSHEIREVELQSAIDLRRLGEEEKLLLGRKVEVEATLQELGESEANVRAHRSRACEWGLYSVFAVAIAVMSAWWSVSWFTSLGWEKALVALTVVVLPIVGWKTFLNYAAPLADLRRLFAGVGLVIVLSSVVAGGCLAAGRMAGTALLEERAAEGENVGGELDQEPKVQDGAARAEAVKRLLGITMVIAVILLGIASEAAAGIAMHEWGKRMVVIRTVTPLWKEREQLLERLAENGEERERARLRPELLRERLAIQGLREEAAIAEREASEERRRLEEERRAASLSRLLWKVALGFGIALCLVLGAVALAIGGETSGGSTVVLLDLSASTGPEEFARNVRAVDGLIRRTEPGVRLVVLAVTGRSFESPVLFRASAPPEVGRFGEHLDAWRERSVAAWRKTGESLRPTASGTDLFGALARAMVEFTDVRGPRRLVILSDMRHVGRGVDLERPRGDTRMLVAELVRQNLVPRLDGVTVHALGAHTAGFEERQWQAVRDFWAEYFRQAGATLVAFSPNRRLTEGRP